MSTSVRAVLSHKWFCILVSGFVFGRQSSVSWLAGWLVGCLVGRLVGQSVGQYRQLLIIIDYWSVSLPVGWFGQPIGWSVKLLFLFLVVFCVILRYACSLQTFLVSELISSNNLICILQSTYLFLCHDGLMILFLEGSRQFFGQS